MADDIDIDEWTTAEVMSCLEQAARAEENSRPIWRLTPALPQVLRALDENEITGRDLKHVDKTFFDEVNITRWTERTPYLSFLELLVKQPARTIARITAGLKSSNERTHETSTAASPIRPATDNDKLPQSSRTALTAANQTEVASTARTRSPQASAEPSTTTKRKRAVLETVYAPPTISTESVEPQESSYMPVRALDPDHMFYGSTKIGQVIDLGVSSHDVDLELICSNPRPAAARYSNDRMRCFLSRSNQAYYSHPQGGTLTLMPYKTTLKTKSSATILRARANGECEAVRAEILDTIDGHRIITEEDPDDQYTDLLRRYPDRLVDQDDTTSIGSIDGESDVSTTDRGSEEMAEEGPEESAVSVEEKEAIIERSIESFVASWTLKLEELELHKARTIWRKMRNSRYMKDLLISTAEQEMSRLEGRLQVQRREFLNTSYSSTEEVSRNCEIMQPTVWQIEEKRWNIDVWQRRKEPASLSSANRSTQAYHLPHNATTASTMSSTLAGLGDEDRLTPSVPGSPSGANAGCSPDHTSPAAMSQESPREQAVGSVHGNHVMADFIDDDDDNVPYSTAAASEKAEKDCLESYRHARPLTEPTGKPTNEHQPHASSVITIHDDDESMDDIEIRSTRTVSVQPKSYGMFSKIDSSPNKMLTNENENTRPRKRIKIETSSQAHDLTIRNRHVNASKKELHDLTAADVDDLDVDQLMMDRSHLKFLLKLLKLEGHHFRMQLKRLCDESIDEFRGLLRSTLTALVKGECHVLAPPNSEEDTLIMLRCARLAVAWWLSSTMPLEDEHHDWHDVQEFVEDSGQVDEFCKELVTILELNDGKLFLTERDAVETPAAMPETIVLDSSSSEDIKSGRETITVTPGKRRARRKRKLVRSQEAHEVRQSAFSRQERFKKMQLSQSDPAQLVDMTDEHEVKIIINIARDADQPPIYINPRIARSLKPHQVEGVQFIWKELTAHDVDIHGCLLAHTMGLGKTLQAITIMLAITEACRADEQSIRRQLPKSLRLKEVAQGNRAVKVLILLPPALTLNWKNEISRWAGESLGDIFTLDQQTPSGRSAIIEQWAEEGGLLLIGFERFRSMVGGSSQVNQVAGMSRHTEILLTQAELVIADEAHVFKNPNSKTAQAIAKLNAKHRLALTGTPLSNDIDEIYALLSWVAPGYLGSRQEFNATFGNPIKEGLYYDSTAAEVRTSKKKLAVLQSETEPKCLRRGIEVLKHDLPPKNEFILTVAPTAIQSAAYRAFVRALSGQIDDMTIKVDQTRIFSWLNAMTLLLNHPWTFRKKLLEQPKPKLKTALQGESAGTDTTSDASDQKGIPSNDVAEPKLEVDDQDVLVQGLSEETRLEIIRDSDITESIDASLSSKTAIFLDLVKETQKAGDKMLVFTSTLVTLDYLSELLTLHKVRHGRIEGKVNSTGRMLLMKRLKDELEVLLISTRAGAYGFNMQEANRVVIFDSGFNPAHEEQAIARSYRLGQRKQVFVYRFVCGGTFEVNMENRQFFKKCMAQRVLDKKNPLRNATRNMSEWLCDPKPVHAKDISEPMGKDPAVLDKIIAAQLAQKDFSGPTKIYSIRTMETLQADAKDADLNEAERREVAAEIAETRLRRMMTRSSTRAEATAATALAAPTPSSSADPSTLIWMDDQQQVPIMPNAMMS